ncbi:hypothetical protein L249_5524 [Ophiocordyceps polyrhachis-furcata BCC 54312]|uniref:Uncharacterized protein n=1 Tax=Ophiocordyceps polyrhachis-furcata BCC 54312 TaxID=1330021 RepID=A0A367LGE6_9HYPO|nr:hypothetical protein L249_5524 [Ophiocordyceps polyrhachis-furcata BCC 54312]
MPCLSCSKEGGTKPLYTEIRLPRLTSLPRLFNLPYVPSFPCYSRLLCYYAVPTSITFLPIIITYSRYNVQRPRAGCSRPGVT